MGGLPEGFWKAALGVGGLATVALAVLWSLYRTILDKLGLSTLGERNTMIIMVLMTVLIFFVAIAGMLFWYLSGRNKNASPGAGETNVSFEIPADWTFRMAAFGLAKAAQATIDFVGFEESELNTALHPQRIKTKTTKVALERLRNTARTPIQPYQVAKQDGLYRITAKGKPS